MGTYRIVGFTGEGDGVLLGSDTDRDRALERGRRLLNQFRKKGNFMGMDFPCDVSIAYPRDAKDSPMGVRQDAPSYGEPSCGEMGTGMFVGGGLIFDKEPTDDERGM